MCCCSILAFLVFNIFFPFTTSISLPSISDNKLSTKGTIYSITFCSSASVSVIFALSRIAFSAQSAFLPLFSATERILATASFTIFSVITCEVSDPPPRFTGCADPMFVLGAMAAMWAAIVINTPAEPAREPLGAT